MLYPSRKHIVIDQNAFRRPTILGPAIALAEEHREFLVVTDMALAEMLKSAEWEGTAKTSLKLLCGKQHLIAASYCTGYLLRREQETGQPFFDFIDEKLTELVRSLILEIEKGDGPQIASIRRNIVETQALAAEQYFCHEKNKQRLQRIVTGLKSDLNSKEIKDIRSKKEDVIRSLLGSLSMTKTCWNALVQAGYEKNHAGWLALVPSFSAHDFLCHASLGIRWLDSLENTKQEKITNDIADMDYVLIASFCRNIATEESGVRESFKRLNAVIELRAKELDDLAATVRSEKPRLHPSDQGDPSDQRSGT